MKAWKPFAPLLIVAIALYLRLHVPPPLLQGEAEATSVIVMLIYQYRNWRRDELKGW